MDFYKDFQKLFGNDFWTKDMIEAFEYYENNKHEFEDEDMLHVQYTNENTNETKECEIPFSLYAKMRAEFEYMLKEKEHFEFDEISLKTANTDIRSISKEVKTKDGRIKTISERMVVDKGEIQPNNFEYTKAKEELEYKIKYEQCNKKIKAALNKGTDKEKIAAEKEKQKNKYEKEQQRIVEQQRYERKIKLAKEFNEKRIKHTNINTILNIVVCALVVFLSNFNPIIIALTFICYDIITIFINKIIINKYIDELYGVGIEEFAEILKYKNKYGTNFEEIDEVRKQVESRMDKDVNEALKNLEENNKEFDKKTTLVKTPMKEFELFESNFNKLKEFDYKNTKVPRKKYGEMLEKIANIHTLVLKNKKSIHFVDATFNIFAEELLKLLVAYNAMDNNKEYDEKINVLLDEFNTYLTNMIEKINYHNKVTIDSSYNVILKNLQELNKETSE